MSDTILRECTWCVAAAALIFGAVVFPLHLGWAGAPIGSLVAYLATAAGLLFMADALQNTGYYWSWRTYPANFAMFLLGLSLPAFMAYAIGSALAPAHDAFGDDACAMDGLPPMTGAAGKEADHLRDPGRSTCGYS